MPTINQVIKYNSDTAITDTKTDIFDAIVADQEYTDLRIKNETGVDVIVTFGESNEYIAKADENIIQAFRCSGDVKLSVATADSPTVGNFFIQLTHA